MWTFVEYKNLKSGQISHHGHLRHPISGKSIKLDNVVESKVSTLCEQNATTRVRLFNSGNTSPRRRAHVAPGAGLRERSIDEETQKLCAESKWVPATSISPRNLGRRLLRQARHRSLKVAATQRGGRRADISYTKHGHAAWVRDRWAGGVNIIYRVKMCAGPGRWQADGCCLQSCWTTNDL